MSPSKLSALERASIDVLLEIGRYLTVEDIFSLRAVSLPTCPLTHRRTDSRIVFKDVKVLMGILIGAPAVAYSGDKRLKETTTPFANWSFPSEFIDRSCDRSDHKS
jgi:hypothetical protein